MKKELVPDSLLAAIKVYAPTLVQASKIIIAEGVTKYPIFVATEDLAKVGIPLVLGQDFELLWNINASSPEEFYVKKIMTKEAAEQFRQVYKDPKKYFCVFLLRSEDVKMLYIPIDKQFIHHK